MQIKMVWNDQNFLGKQKHKKKNLFKTKKTLQMASSKLMCDSDVLQIVNKILIYYE